MKQEIPFTPGLVCTASHWPSLGCKLTLFPAIFGEGVGAMIVGVANKENINDEWTIETMSDELVEKEWRVAARWNESKSCSEVIARSRLVKQTYLTYVATHANLAINSCGGQEAVYRLCLHESNPHLIKTVADRIGFPDERIPSISANVGTLAIVSSFALLDSAINGYVMSGGQRNRIALILIGESLGIRVGHLVLSSSSRK